MEKWRDEKLICLDEKKNEKMKNIVDINLLLYSYYLKYYIFIFNYITHKYKWIWQSKGRKPERRLNKKSFGWQLHIIFFHIKLEKILEIILGIDGKDPLESEVGSMDWVRVWVLKLKLKFFCWKYSK